MDAKRSLIASLALALGGSVAMASEPYDDYYSETLAPTAAQVSYSDSSASSGCSSGCDNSSGCCDSAICCDSVCDTGCDSGCDSLSCGSGCGLGLCGGKLFGGLIKRSDKCFDDFISPMTNPVFFEDPRTLTEARAIFINHILPDSLGGNSVQVYALQARLALSKRLSLIAVKDGLINTASPVLDSGYADISAGLKYNLIRDVCNGRIVSTGFTYEAPSGSNKSLQGNGDGVINFFVTGGTRLGKKAHFVSASGLRLPFDDDAENSVFYWSNHLDRQIGDRPIYLFTELNWYNYMSSGNAFPLSVEGGDLFNFGSPGITGNDLVTAAIGSKIKPRSNVEAGVAWEFPMTERKGILDNRLTADLILRF